VKRFLLPLFAAAFSVHAENIAFPEDAAVDVTKAPYNAKGDGTADDTEAIQKALDEGHHLVYLPNGTYLVSSGLRWGKTQRQIVLQGQSRDGTTIKLKDECGGFNLADKPLPVIQTGKPSAAQHFRNAIRNLTVDTGRGNPGAIGVQFVANGEGTVDMVRIQCGDTGPIGLDLAYTTIQGPCLITHVIVIGFEQGIATAGKVNGITFDDIRLESQKSSGIHNDSQTLFIRGLDFTGGCTAFRNAGHEALAVLLDSHLSGTGNSHGGDAVFNGEKCAMYVRNLQTEGYRAAVKNDGGHQQSPEGKEVGEWFSHPPVPLFPSEPRAIGLTIKDAPDVPWDAPDSWVSVAQFQGAKGNEKPAKKRGAKEDWTDAIQQAIDSGKSTVYFPKEGAQFSGTVHVRGSVRRIIGCEQPWGRRSQGTWIIDDGDGPVVLERFDWTGAPTVVQQNSHRPLIIRNVMGGSYEIGKDAGDTFFQDVSAGKIRMGSGASVWARQLTLDDKAESKIVNDGGNLWILGLKTLNDPTQVESRNGAHTQVDGCLVQNNSNKPKPPCFLVQDSGFSITMGEAPVRRQPYTDLISETRGSETKTLKNGDVPSRAGGSLITLFSTNPGGN